MQQRFEAAKKLHTYLVDHHWRSGALLGPDPGVRWNYRVGRFVKSYLPVLRSLSPSGNNLYYLQGQGYWALANWQFYTLTHAQLYREIAMHCSKTMLARQRDDGAWRYPNPEWDGRVATAEGTWAAIGLLESYRRTGDEKYLAGARRWHEYLIHTIGFQADGNALAINYFAGRGTNRIPNNSLTALRFLTELADATDDQSILCHRAGLMRFLQSVQKPSGEFPYAAGSVKDHVHYRGHFQCYQYHSFACMNLVRTFELTGAPDLVPMINRLLDFLRTGLAADGHLYYECGNRHRAVTYHAAAFAAAFTMAAQAGFAACTKQAEQAYAYVLAVQKADGSFVYSRRDYHLLADRTAYPRYLAMMLLHLLQPEAQCVS